MSITVRLWGWFEIISGTIIFFMSLYFGLLDVFSGGFFGHGFVAMQGLFFYAPLGLWLYIAGRLLLKPSLLGQIMSGIALAFICLIISAFLSMAF